MIGERLGPYLVERELGTGGMGRVYAATVSAPVAGLAVGTRVAVKVVHANLLDRPVFLQRFLREAKLGHAVRQDNVVRTYDAGKVSHADGWKHVLVMEYVEGQTLRHLLAELGSVPEQLCRHIGGEIAAGLAAIHAAGAVHRDMKPENVLLTAGHVVKVMDLGVAQLADEALRLSQTGTIVGTVQYVAPEQLHGKEAEVDARVDLYALGLVLYELATGTNPFLAADVGQILLKIMREEPRRLGEVRPELSPFFEEVVHTLLAKERDDRFASAELLAATLADGERSAWWRDRAVHIRSETRRPLRRVRIDRETGVHGRDAELQVLSDAFDLALGGAGQVVLVEGEAGIGKSRLVDELIGRLGAAEVDFDFLCGGYPPGGAATAAGALVTAFREHFEESGLEERLVRYLDASPAVVPAFAALLRGEPLVAGEQPLTQETRETAFVHTLRALALRRTIVLLVDDLHQAPEEGGTLFTALALAIRSHRVLLVGTLRPGCTATWRESLASVPYARDVALGRLERDEVTRMLLDATGSQSVAEALSDPIQRKAEGNPFFVLEILRELREDGSLAQLPGGGWAKVRAVDTAPFPATVADLVRVRIAALPQEEREMLDVAACCGFSFDPDLLVDVLASPRLPLLRTLVSIERDHRLVRSVGGQFEFDHNQVQEAVYDALPAMLREAYHADIARVLERRARAAESDPAALDGELLTALCEHFLAGAQHDSTRRYLPSTLDYLESSNQRGRGVRLARRALALERVLAGAQRVETLLRVAAWLDLAARREDQRRALDEADAEARALGDATLESRVAHALATHALRLSRFEDAQQHARRALDVARAAGDAEAEADATNTLGVVAFAGGNLDEAHSRYERSRRIARKVGSRRAELAATECLASLAHQRGRYEEAREEIRHLLGIARDTDDLAAQARGLGSLGAVFLAEGNLEQARGLFTKHLELARELGDRTGEALATSRLGLVAYARCQYEEAHDCHQRHLELARETGDRQGQARALGDVGRVLEAVGEHEQARSHHEWALALAREIGHTRVAFLSMARLGGVLLSLGDTDGAWRRVRAALSLAQQYGDRRTEAALWVRLAQVRCTLGDIDGARKALTAAERTAGKDLAPRSAALTALTTAEFAEAAGDVPGARTAYGEALHAAQKSGDSALETRVHVESARLEWEDGRSVEATAHANLALIAADEAGVPGARVLALVVRALVAGGDSAEAARALSDAPGRLDVRSVLLAHFLLYRTTFDVAHLRAAEEQLRVLIAGAPEEFRRTLVSHVPLHRAVAEAWNAHKSES